jgi:hypothetical protein
MPRPSHLILALLLALIVLPACASRREAGLRGARAMIIYPRGMEREAELAASRMRIQGLRVEKQVQGPLGREESSLTVYDVAQYPARAEELSAVLSDLGPLQVLPFRRRGSGGTDVVLWLVQPGERATESLPDTTPSTPGDE